MHHDFVALFNLIFICHTLYHVVLTMYFFLQLYFSILLSYLLLRIILVYDSLNILWVSALYGSDECSINTIQYNIPSVLGAFSITYHSCLETLIHPAVVTLQKLTDWVLY